MTRVAARVLTGGGRPPGWPSLDPDDPNSDEILAEALVLALELATFAPSLRGGTAVDRLIRQHKAAGCDELAALQMLKQASFRLLRIKSSTDVSPLIRACGGAYGHLRVRLRTVR